MLDSKRPDVLLIVGASGIGPIPAKAGMWSAYIYLWLVQPRQQAGHE